MNAEEKARAGFVKITGAVLDSSLITHPDDVELAKQYEYFIEIDGERYYYSQEYIDRTPYSGHVASLFHIVTNRGSATMSHFEEEWNKVFSEIKTLQKSLSELEHTFVELSRKIRKEMEDERY